MISIKDFKFEKIIGKGSFGQVYTAIQINTNKRYAIKKIKISNLTQYERKYVINEIKVLASHNCINIINYYTVFINKEHIYIVTEHAKKGDILQLIKNHKLKGTKFTEDDIWKYFIQICIALQYLHANNIIHRDIKSANIFIDQNNNIKVGDFGTIKIMQNYMMYAQTQIGTPYYMSPEIFKNVRYNNKCDIWGIRMCII